MRTVTTLLLGAIALLPLSAQEQPTCNKCPATYVSSDEIQAYLKRVEGMAVSDQQVRAVDVGKTNVDIGVVYRGKLAAPAKQSVAEHDQVSEVYHVIDGSATLMTGPDIVDMKPRPADDRAVRVLNGPGGNGASIRNGVYASAQGRRRHRDSCRHRPLVHAHRRSHSLPDGPPRSRQNRPAEGRSCIESRSEERRQRQLTRAPRSARRGDNEECASLQELVFSC